jgi:hypothetical protein
LSNLSVRTNWNPGLILRKNSDVAGPLLTHSAGGARFQYALL